VNKKLLSLYGLKWSPFAPDVPVEALHVPPRIARFIQVLCVAARAAMGHTADVKNLLDDLAGFRPTFVLAVPRVFEKIYHSAEAKAQAGGRGWIFRAASDTAIAWSRAQDEGGPGLALRARHALFDRLVYGKLRATLGGQVTAAVSGGAPLGPRLGHFFRGIGVLILEGWGLTETTAPATVNAPGAIRIGTVGRPLPGVTVQVPDDGELLVSGVNVMAGYLNNPGAIESALTGGWFHTAGRSATAAPDSSLPHGLSLQPTSFRRSAACCLSSSTGMAGAVLVVLKTPGAATRQTLRCRSTSAALSASNSMTPQRSMAKSHRSNFTFLPGNAPALATFWVAFTRSCAGMFSLNS
jgi:hypothetical protein